MLLILLACAPNQMPLAKTRALGAPDHFWPSSEGLTFAWSMEQPKQVVFPIGSVRGLELRHLEGGDQLTVVIEGREILLKERRGGRLDSEAQMLTGWGLGQASVKGVNALELQPWAQAGERVGEPPEHESEQGDSPYRALADAVGQACYANRAARVPGLGGVVLVEMQGAGELRYVAVVGDTMGDALFDDCLVRGLLGQQVQEQERARVVALQWAWGEWSAP